MPKHQKIFLGLFFLASLLLAGCQTQPPEIDALASNVSSFTLMNADTDRPISGFDPMPDGATLDFSKLSTRNLNIRANAGNAGSVRFALDGNKNYRTENNGPFALAGNSGSNYFAWTPSAGKRTLTATAYSGSNASGQAGKTKTITFNVVNGSGASGSPPPSSSYKDLAQVHVNVSRGSDSNPGTADKPLKTLNKGLEKALSNRRSGKGTLIRVYPGTYRESIDRYASSSGKPIVFEAVEPGKAIISGSEVWTGWSCSSGVCSHRWPYNWGSASSSDNRKSALSRRREMVIVNGKNLDQTLSKSSLKAGSFYVDERADKIFVKPPSGGTLSNTTVEVSTRETLFRTPRLNDLVLKGLVFQHASSHWKPAVEIQTQEDVLLDGVNIRWNGFKSFNISLGNDVTFRNTSWNNNGGDWGVWKSRDLRWENTEGSYNNWREKRGRTGDYSGDDGKFYHAHGVTIRNHKAVGNYMHGLWLDTDVKDLVIDRLYACNNSAYGFKLEATVGPVKVTNSTMCDNGRGGVEINGAHNLTFEYNTVENNDDEQMYVWQGPRSYTDFRSGRSYTLVPEKWSVKNNIIQGRGDQLLWRFAANTTNAKKLYSSSTLDYNRYAQTNNKSTFKNEGYGFSSSGVTLDEWRRRSGKEKNSSFSSQQR